ncbi:MAG: glutathione S-transferase N-terminal domain-containing protein [Deltaproteobacteria bacterium]|nr:glutathione S-transferase N-terminal domain-containing protein [Deltaproteobacteria bacterium]
MSSTVASTVCLWRGTQTHPARTRPEKILELYDMEGCPFCRLVREVISELDLEVMIYPCPKGGSRFRREVEKRGGRQQFPYLVDPNTGTEMYESRDIIDYLFKTYGQRSVPPKWKARPISLASSIVGSVLRGGRGVRLKKASQVEKPLELYSFESSPYARPVREKLCELEIPYLLHNVGKVQLADYILPNIRKRYFPQIPVKGEMRTKLQERGGRLMIPYLVDPNTGKSFYESADILDYLTVTYCH